MNDNSGEPIESRINHALSHEECLEPANIKLERRRRIEELFEEKRLRKELSEYE